MTISIRPANQADIPSLVDIYLSSTRSSAFFTQVFPDVPPVRAWFVDTLSHELRNERNARFLAAVDVDDDDDDETIIAFAKWVWIDSTLPPATQEEDTPWPEGADQELARSFFEETARRHKAIMGERDRSPLGKGGHWYLEMLFTSPSHQRRGAGSRLMAEILTEADADGVEAYLEASPDGNALYRRWGFETFEEVVVSLNDRETFSNDLMVRTPLAQVGMAM